MNETKMFMHNTFWHENQVAFRFDTFKVGDDKEVIESLNLNELNKFLGDNGFNLFPFSYEDPARTLARPGNERAVATEGDRGNDLNSSIGKYLFREGNIRNSFKGGSTIVASFFHFNGGQDARTNMATTSPGMTSMTGNGDYGPDDSKGPVPDLVNLVNRHLEELRKGVTLRNGEVLNPIPIYAAAPIWLCGGMSSGSDHVAQGCPLIPPIPVPADMSRSSSPGLWPITLPDLPPELQSMTGEGVTVLILDTLPKPGQIKTAVEAAGDNNLLLMDVANNVQFNYPVLSDAIDLAGPMQPITGKDIHGRLVGFHMTDHGLFIAGILRDLAPDANVECIRVLNDSCVGDIEALINALNSILNRMSLIDPGTNKEGDLYNKPVVINLSLVATPSDEDVVGQGFDPAHIAEVRATLLGPIQSLVDLGAVFVASAGNEGDLRYNPMNQPKSRPEALYPAAFAYHGLGDHADRMIPVGAVDKDGHATEYSCYPGPDGIATWGGDVPKDSDIMTVDGMTRVTNIDALIGIHSSLSYPALSVDDRQSTYPVPNAHGWAYWVGTSFATAIVSAVAARVLESQLRSAAADASVRQTILSSAATRLTPWTNLPPNILRDNGRVIWAVQEGQSGKTSLS